MQKKFHTCVFTKFVAHELQRYIINGIRYVLNPSPPFFFAAPAAPRKVSILSNKDGLVINWIPPTCDEMSSKPVKYQLSWCRTDGKSNHCQGKEWRRKSHTGHIL